MLPLLSLFSIPVGDALAGCEYNDQGVCVTQRSLFPTSLSLGSQAPQGMEMYQVLGERAVGPTSAGSLRRPAHTRFST